MIIVVVVTYMQHISFRIAQKKQYYRKLVMLPVDVREVYVIRFTQHQIMGLNIVPVHHYEEITEQISVLPHGMPQKL